MLTESELRTLLSRDVLDKDGKSLGNIETFFNDRNTGTPEWIGVFSGTFRQHHRLVPVRGAESEGNAVRVPWTKEQVESAPDYGKPEGGISEEMEREAYRHYGLEPAAV
jgi:sporulation protein YlmC with PRC-barrel domain